MYKVTRLTICTTLCLFALSINAQQVQLNEVVSSNSDFYDEDGDTPDWFEISNTTPNTISLEGWSITDKEDNPTKWTLPSGSLGPDEYLYIWASGKDKRNIITPRTLIDRNDDWQYIVPSQAVSLDWIDLDFNDSNWQTGKTGFGYADNDDVTTIEAGSASVFMRKRFTIVNVDDVNELILDIDYDDGFVAYLNGVEVARANIEGARPQYDDYSITDHEAQMYSGGRPDRFVVSSEALLNGENVLSIQAHNVAAFSSDFSLIPFLSILYSSPSNAGIDPPEILDLNSRTAHTNFKLSIGETLFLYDASGNKVDELFIKDAPPGVSIGRRIQDNNLVLFDSPTPGARNEGSGFEGYLEGDIVFSHPGGIVDNLQLSLSTVGPENEIRYTLDATVPDINSTIYSDPILINQNTIVRARVFRDGFLPSRTQSNTYLTNASHDMPIVSLVTDPKNLFDTDIGIYALGDNYESNFPFFGANFWEDWERPVNYTLYEEDNSIGVSLDAGIKIFGGWSRAQDQRSFSLFARGGYGTNQIDYPLFPQNNYDTYQALVLRNAGNDFLRSNLRDITLTSLMDGSGIETQAFRSVATYINGEYWGMYNMREKVNEHFLASKQGVNPDEIDMLGPFGELILGDNTAYIELFNFLESNSFASNSTYQTVADQIDIDNFIIYNIAQIYFNNTDWPENNNKYWKPKGGKWRWILYDTDFGFGLWNPNSYNNNTLDFALEANGPAWPNPPNSTLMLRKLVENQIFKHQFINKFADELNSRFLSDNVEKHIENIASSVSIEMNNHFSRWGESFDFHNEQIDVMKDFAKNRPTRVKSHIRSVFDLPAIHEVSVQINNTSAGYVKLNSLTIEDSNWRGDYFETVPIKVSATAKPGYIFLQWTGNVSSTDPELTIDMQSDMVLTAIFIESSEEQSVVINEINYKSLETEDAGDWVELYNPNNSDLDLTDWIFTDSDVEAGYQFPQGTSIGGKDFLIIARDQLKFDSQFPNVENTVGNIGFGLSSGGEDLMVFNNNQELVDAISYDSIDPWSEMANGLGYTLELISPELDNAHAENWASINEKGSPGKVNEKSTSTNDQYNKSDLKVFPNPFDDNTTIEFTLLHSSYIQITLINAQGSIVKSIFDGKIDEGNHILNNNFQNLNRGVYYLKLSFDDNVETIKWAKI